MDAREYGTMSNTITNNQLRALFVFMIIFGTVTSLFGLGFLSSIGLSKLLPIKPAVSLAIFLSIALGFLFRNKILKESLTTRKTFLIGCGLFLLLLPFFDLGAVAMMQNQFQGTHADHSAWSDYFTLYIIVVIYSFLFVGSWLSIISGFLFVFFNKFKSA